MERLPFAQLNSERSKMMERLRQMPIADRGVRLRAINELETRVQNWWGGDLPPLSQHVVTPPNRHPVDLPADPAEVWIVRAISPTSRPAVFGVKKDGAVYTVDSTGQYQMFVTGLSSLLDQAADLCRLNNNGSELLERDGRFYTSFNEERQALAVVVSSTSSDGVHVNQRGFWRRIVSVLPWVHDDPQGRSRPSGADEQEVREHGRGWEDEANLPGDVNARPIHQLVVGFEAADWPESGVLSELGYKVGKSGLGPVSRRQLLRNAVSIELVASTADAEIYILQWGSPSSKQRVAKIQRCLAGFANGARRRSADMSEAIADWESDLAWFNAQYDH
ncbi:hypothetical protein [Mycolicibacterium poriferae]|uniref:hypothetical protein n=1 Tax=Mycolicibacterium poriferae TaxID=39694 RepID=UPI0024B8F1D6|nr:hypothetical protein [Mycolicibacterium poriferae]